MTDEQDPARPTRGRLLLPGAAVAMAGATIAVLVATGSATGTPTPVSSSATLPASAKVSLLAEPGIGGSALTEAQRSALAGLGDGLSTKSSLSLAARGAAVVDSARAIAGGGGVVHRVEHPAGVTVSVVQNGDLLCLNDAPTGAADAGGTCTSATINPAAPPSSITQEDDGERVVALMPDGVDDVKLTEGDGTITPVTVTRNIAAIRVKAAKQLTWRDATGQARQLNFG